MKKIINYIRESKACSYGYEIKCKMQWKSLPKDYKRKVRFYQCFSFTAFVSVYIIIIFIMYLFSRVM